MVEAAQGVRRRPGESWLVWRGLRRRLDGIDGLLARNLLAEDEHVGNDFGPGVLSVSARRESDGRHQFQPLRSQLLADRTVLLVHRAGRRDVHNEATGPHLVGRLQEEVVVDLRLMLVVFGVMHLVVAERDVRRHEVIEVVGRLEILETLMLDLRRWVEHAKDRGRGCVLLDGAAARLLRQILRHHAQIVTGAGRRLEEPPALEPQLPSHLPVRIDHLGRGVVRVHGRCPRRLVFLFRQQSLENLAFLLPLRIAVVAERFGHRTPPDVLRQNLHLFGRRRRATFRLDVAQRPDRLDVVLELRLLAALGEVAILVAEVTRAVILRVFWRRRV